jgi:hypothetical protein
VRAQQHSALSSFLFQPLLAGLGSRTQSTPL